MEKRFTKSLISQVFVIAILTVVALSTLAADCGAYTFMCVSNPDYFSKRCTVNPDAITKVTDGVVYKGHLVGCQFKSFSCMPKMGSTPAQCRDNFGSAEIPFDFQMSDLEKFCYLLCKNPECSAGGWK